MASIADLVASDASRQEHIVSVLVEAFADLIERDPRAFRGKFRVEAKITEVIGGRDEAFTRDLAAFGAEYGALTREDHRRFVDAFRNGMIPGVEAD